METTQMTVTPEQAERWLEEKSPNRNIRETRVRPMVSDIKEGRWQMTHQGIASIRVKDRG